MRRGELWTAPGGQHYAGKPRPVLVVQDDRFDATDAITICPLTTDPTEIPLLRVRLGPESGSGLAKSSSIMVDKLTTMPRSRLGEYIGAVSDTDMLALSRRWWSSWVSPDPREASSAVHVTQFGLSSRDPTRPAKQATT